MNGTGAGREALGELAPPLHTRSTAGAYCLHQLPPKGGVLAGAEVDAPTVVMCAAGSAGGQYDAGAQATGEAGCEYRKKLVP